MIHDYADDAEHFAEDLMLAKEYTHLSIQTYNQVRTFAMDRMNLADGALPDPLALPAQSAPDT